jgi:MoxR-like ATPase
VELNMNSNVEQLQYLMESTRTEIQKVIIGQDDAIAMALVTIFTGQHALIEGLPGIGKTLLVKTFSRVLGCDFNRIQFTPDLMPSDITGNYIFNTRESSFEFAAGPVFTEFLLADEINRAPAKTQSALLQAMQERCVTVDRNTLALSSHFTVFATQNPVEFEGTYPLPEAQKDRFMLLIKMGYPEDDEEKNLAARFISNEAPEDIVKGEKVKQILTRESLEFSKSILKSIIIKEDIVNYAVDIVRRTRKHPGARIGAGPRGTQSLLLAARAYAIVNGRNFVIPDDIKDLAQSVLGHRIIIRPEYEMEGVSAHEIVQSILNETPVPQ